MESKDWVVCFCSALMLWLFLDTNIPGKTWYFITKDATWDNVHVDRKPTDCDWGHAPLGDKDCSYNQVVVEGICGISTTGKPIYSADDGKNWNPTASGGACEPSVHVGWTKTEGVSQVLW